MGLRKERNEFVLLTGTAHPTLAEDIGKLLGTQVYHAARNRFPDGSPDVRIPKTVRRRDVIIIQPCAPPEVSYYFDELKDIVDAAKRTSAREVMAVVPFFPFARSDRMNRERAPIAGARAAVELVEAGADHIVTVDLHSEGLQAAFVGIYKKRWDNLYSSYPLVPAIKKQNLTDIIIASPDRGGAERALKYADFFTPPPDVAIFYKIRDKETRLPTINRIIGDVAGKNVIFVDDMLDSGNTIVEAANYAMKCGALSVKVLVAYGLFTGVALDKITSSSIEKIYITDSLPARNEVRNHPKIQIEPIAPLLAEGIKRIYAGESIKDLFLSTL